MCLCSTDLKHKDKIQSQRMKCNNIKMSFYIYFYCPPHRVAHCSVTQEIVHEKMITAEEKKYGKEKSKTHNPLKVPCFHTVIFVSNNHKNLQNTVLKGRMLAYEVISGRGRMQPDTRDFVLLKGESGGLHLIYHQTLPFWKKSDVPKSTPLIPGALHTDTDCFIMYLTLSF